MAVFEKGDIVRVSLDPVAGRELSGASRPALVLTSSEFNRLGDVLVAPITQGGDYSRFAGFAVSLMGTGCKTQGVALINKIRMLDLSARKAKKVERVPQIVIDDALSRLSGMLEL
jgi:mRNA interferase ChpB